MEALFTKSAVACTCHDLHPPVVHSQLDYHIYKIMNAKSKKPRKLVFVTTVSVKRVGEGWMDYPVKQVLALATFASPFCEPGRLAFLIPNQNRLENSCKLCCNLL